jgi:glutaconate CoA-transferase, subunit B
MNCTADELMTVAASRLLKDEHVCFVGIGLPSAACNLARLTHAPRITLIYESGTIGTQPTVLPLSIGDGELCTRALTTVSVPEIFRYWLQGGHVSIGFLSGAQVDRFGNLNSTVIGSYHQPKVRLPGAGGAPEIATSCGEVFIIMRQSPRTFVSQVDFLTTLGHGEGAGHRGRLGFRSKGPTKVITDLCVMEPSPETSELTVTSLHPGVTTDHVKRATGWDVQCMSRLDETPAPTPHELTVLRDLQERTAAAHGS